jgi:hypothetical protein
MECFLHIGTEKTASTTLQLWLYENRQFLSEQGIALSETAGRYNNRALCALFQNSIDDFYHDRHISTHEERKIFDADFKENFIKEIDFLKKNHDTIIISSEHFHSRLQNEEDIEKLYSFLHTIFRKITVICYFREQSSLRLSLYSTAIKAGDTRSFHEFAEGQTHDLHYYDYYSMFSKWSRVFGKENLQPVLFQSSAWLDHDIRKDFLNRIKANLPQTPGLGFLTRNSNESMTARQIALGRWINRLLPRYQRRNGKYCKLREICMTLIIEADFLRSIPLYDPCARAFQRQCQASNMRFFRMFFETDKNLFSTDQGKHGKSAHSRT